MTTTPDDSDRSRWPFAALLPFQIIYNYPMPPLMATVANPQPHEWPPPIRPDVQRWRDDTRDLTTGRDQIYVHVPFCPFICAFCPFYKLNGSGERTRDQREQYVAALVREIEMYGTLPGVRARKFSVIYFGGGTPTELSIAQLTRILDALRTHIPLTDDVEITLEAVARQLVVPEYLAACVEAGFNRVSFGIQSLDPKVRKAIGRVGDDVEDYARAIEVSRSIDPEMPVNVELMACCPDQSLESLLSDIDTVASWNPDSIDVFNYVMMPGTPLFRAIMSGKRSQPRYGEAMLAMRRRGAAALANHGFHHIAGEVYVRRGRDRDLFSDSFYGAASNAMHAVLPLGPSAIGHIDGTTYRNECTLEAYQRAIEGNRLPVATAVSMDRETARRRAMLFGLANLEVADILFETGRERRALERWRRCGLIEPHERNWKLTAEGKLWFNQMQIEVLPISDLASMIRMVGSAEDQQMLIESGSPLGQELMALAGSSGGWLGALKKVGYRTSLKVLGRLGSDLAKPLGWTGVVDR